MNQIKSILTKFVEQTEQLAKFLNEEQRLQLSQEYESRLRKLSEASEELEFPVIIGVKWGGVHHVNKAFREMTQWDGTVPSPPEDGHLPRFFTAETIEVMKPGFIKAFLSPTKKMIINGALVGGKGEEIKGRFAITLKKDVFSLPQIFYFQFIPDEMIEEVF